MTDLDEALDRFQRGGLEYGGGLSNHGPMAAEALVALGHPALLTGWVDLYAPRLPPFEPAEPFEGGSATQRLAAADRAGADARAAARWIASFERELHERGWQPTLRAALPLLAPGLFAAAGHGLLRTAHAVRALEHQATPVRERELAFGLGYWAAAFQTLPGAPGARPVRPAHEALRALGPMPEALRRPGFFTDAVAGLGADTAFLDTIAGADLDAAQDLLAALCREAARLYLANPQARIAYAHAVTVPAAVRLLLPHADAAARGLLLRGAFHASAALHRVGCARLEAPAPPPEPVQQLAASVDELRYRAACSLQEHAIKLAEACLREHALAADPVLRLAAADAALSLEG